jgi:hypothetical protein
MIICDKTNGTIEDHADLFQWLHMAIALQDWRKSLYNLQPGRDLNWFPPKYKSGMLRLNCAGCCFFTYDRNWKIHTWSAYADIVCA